MQEDKVMKDGKPYVMCPNCSGRIATAKSAEEVEVTCDRCKATLRYWVNGRSVRVEIMALKEEKSA